MLGEELGRAAVRAQGSSVPAGRGTDGDAA